jgi:capsular polysaccharide synthesis protein
MVPIQMLWIGPRLSALERLSIASFLANGHDVHLYTYEDVEGIPEGTRHAYAGDVIPASFVFTQPAGFGKGSYAGFSDIFRYKLLHDRGGIWCDADVVCLRPFDFNETYIVARERLAPHVASGDVTEKLNACVLKAPADSRVMRECYEISMAIDKNSLEWGEIGPNLVTERFAKHNLMRHALPVHAICPVDWWEVKKLVTYPVPDVPGGYAIHFWNEVWRFHAMDKDAIFPTESAYEALKRRYDVS